jgi:hypothetical protein
LIIILVLSKQTIVVGSMAPPKRQKRKAAPVGKAHQSNQRKKAAVGERGTPVTTTSKQAPAGQTTPAETPQPPWTGSGGRAGRSGPTTLALPNGHAEIPQDIIARRGEAVSTVTVSTKPSETWFESTRPGTDPDEARRIQLIDFVRRDLFPGWKFFTDPRQLVFDASETSLVRHICLGMHLKRDYWADWWELNKTELVTTLNRKRTDVTAMVKKIFIGTLVDRCGCYFFGNWTNVTISLFCTTDLRKQFSIKKTRFPSLNDFLEMSQKESSYQLFCSHFLRPIVGTTKWKHNFLRKRMTLYVTISDEAFALLTLENNYDRWIDMWRNDNLKTSEVEAKWTNAGQSLSNGQSKRFNGWKQDGYTRYNELYDLVEADREDAGRRSFEIKLKEALQANNKETPSVRVRTEVEPTTEIFPRHDFANVMTARAEEEESEEDVQSVAESNGDPDNDADGPV